MTIISSSSCGQIVARDGEWITLTYIPDNSLIASYMVKEDICEKGLNQMIVFKYNKDPKDVNIKVKRNRR